MHNTSGKIILDFCDSQTTSTWSAIDDRIMGGQSQSQPRHIANTGLRFSGRVSLENNGGFASIRSEPGDFNLAGYTGLRLRLRGDGKTYKLSLRTDRFFDGVSYQATITTRRNEWQEVEILFETFAPTHHGIRLTSVPPLDPAGIKSFGFFIADLQAGPFQLDIAWVMGV